ncbi:MAG: HAD-IC family P-type ATPase, partial [Pontibacterium sp.]
SQGARAWLSVNDQLRPEAKTTLKALSKLGLEIHMLTGDASHAVQRTAQALDIRHVVSGVSPEGKLEYIKALQASDKRVIMIGDGINDIPVLAGAQTSVAMGAATDLAKTNADAVLVNGDLSRLTTAVSLSRRTRIVVRQNLSWSALYNFSVLPLAAFGLIPPYLAALGMSASSLVVVGNALRLSRVKRS